MAKPTKYKAKGSSLEKAIGDAILKGIQHSMTPQKPIPKGKVAAAKPKETATKAVKETPRKDIPHSDVFIKAPKYDNIYQIVRHAISKYGGKTAKEQPTPIKTKKSSKNDEPEIIYGGPMDSPHVRTPKGASPKPELNEKDFEVEEEPVASEPKKAKPKLTPYRTLDSFGTSPKRTQYGEYKHPLYSMGTKFWHTTSPHEGMVKYVTTLDQKGNPLVQPIDKDEAEVGKAFQAQTKNLWSVKNPT